MSTPCSEGHDHGVSLDHCQCLVVQSMFARLPSDPPGNSPGVWASPWLIFEKEDVVDPCVAGKADFETEAELRGCALSSGAYIRTKTLVVSGWIYSGKCARSDYTVVSSGSSRKGYE
jgi:hypothetical protein